MSLNDELNDFFAQEKEQIIDQPILFKEKLGIGEKAYAFLRYRENLATFSEAIGIGATASGIASAAWWLPPFSLHHPDLSPQRFQRWSATAATPWGGSLARVLLLAAPMLASPDSSNPQRKMGW